MSLRSRILQTIPTGKGSLRGGAVGVGVMTSAVALYLTGRDKQTGLDARRAARHPGPYSAAERRAAVESYLDALTHSAAAFEVPFAPDCVRVENGLRTGFGATHMHWDLHVHLQYSVMSRLENVRIEDDPDGRPDVLHAEFDVVTVFGARAHVSEYFHVPAADGLIHRIDAEITLG